LIKSEEEALWAKMAPLLTSTEQKYGSLRPDLWLRKKIISIRADPNLPFSYYQKN